MKPGAKPGEVVAQIPKKGVWVGNVIYTCICLFAGAYWHEDIIWWRKAPEVDERLEKMCRAPRYNGGVTTIVMEDGKLKCWRFES